MNGRQRRCLRSKGLNKIRKKGNLLTTFVSSFGNVLASTIRTTFKRRFDFLKIFFSLQNRSKRLAEKRFSCVMGRLPLASSFKNYFDTMTIHNLVFELLTANTFSRFIHQILRRNVKEIFQASEEINVKRKAALTLVRFTQ